MASKSPATVVYATRDKILKINDMKFDDVYVPEWDVTVRIRSLTAAERDNFEASLIDQRGKRAKMDMQNARARLVVLCAIDESGASLFHESDIPALGMKNASAIDRIFARAQVLSGITDEDMDEMVGELKADPKGASTTD